MAGRVDAFQNPEVSGKPRLYVAPAGVDLGPLNLIPEGKARNFVLELGSGRFYGFAVRRAGAVHGFVDRCPHAGLPLAKALDDYLSPDGAYIACAWHGALFDPVTGACLGGPCAGQALSPWPLHVVDGRIRTV